MPALPVSGCCTFDRSEVYRTPRGSGRTLTRNGLHTVVSNRADPQRARLVVAYREEAGLVEGRKEAACPSDEGKAAFPRVESHGLCRYRIQSRGVQDGRDSSESEAKPTTTTTTTIMTHSRAGGRGEQMEAMTALETRRPCHFRASMVVLLLCSRRSVVD